MRRVRFRGSNGMFCLKYIIASATFTPLQAYLFSRLTKGHFITFILRISCRSDGGVYEKGEGTLLTLI